MRAANFQGGGKVKGKFVSFWSYNLRGGPGDTRAGLVQAMAAARKTDKIVCDLLSWGLMGEDALGNCRLQHQAGGKYKSLLGKRSPWLKTGDALQTAFDQMYPVSCSCLLVVWF